jgi:hypothetical protein
MLIARTSMHSVRGARSKYRRRSRLRALDAFRMAMSKRCALPRLAGARAAAIGVREHLIAVKDGNGTHE